MAYDPYSLGLGLAGSIWSYGQQQNALEDAQRRQEQAIRDAMAYQQQQWELSQRQMQPWLTAGTSALAEQQALMGLGGDTEAAMRALESSPGYQSRLQQGERSLAGSTAARGGMGSGKAMVAASNYGQDYAANEYANRLAQLAGMSGQGMSTASNLGGMGAQYAGGMGNLATQYGNVGATSSLANANINASTLGGLANLGMQAYQNWNQPTLNAPIPSGGMTSTGSVPYSSYGSGGSYWG